MNGMDDAKRVVGLPPAPLRGGRAKRRRTWARQARPEGAILY